VSDPRTITIPTLDHGPVTLPEPFWCAAEHLVDGYRADIAHEGEEHPLTVDAMDGQVQVATAFLYQRPFAERSTTAVVVAVDFGAEANEYDAQSLAGLADALVSYAVGPLHSLIERLQLLEGGES
jgi:hypothetical protein